MEDVNVDETTTCALMFPFKFHCFYGHIGVYVYYD